MDGPLSLIPDGGLPDPGAAGPWRVSTRHGELSDPDRARTLPFKLYLPDAPRPGGLIVFSHGLGGTREGGARWLAHWASHGFVALAVAYAMWGSFGILGTSLGGWLFFSQKLRPCAFAGMALLMTGMALLHMS